MPRYGAEGVGEMPAVGPQRGTPPRRRLQSGSALNSHHASLLALLGARQLSHSKHSQPSWIMLHSSLWHRARQLLVQLWMLKLDMAHCTFHHKPSASSHRVLVQLSSFWYCA